LINIVKHANLQNQMQCRRIIWLDGAVIGLNVAHAMLHAWFKNLELFTFLNGDDAWQELCRKAPDMFATNFVHKGMNTIQMLEALAEQGVNYPIIINTFYPRDCMQYIPPRLNARYFDKNRLVVNLWPLLQELFGPAENPNYEELFEQLIP
jgi:hypothetical protein